MTSYQHQAGQIASALNLPLQAVAISFTNDLPEGISHFKGTVPAGCAFWEKAASQVFATSTGDHELCSIGIHTHNLANAPESQPVELQTALLAMTGLDYVREEEIAQIPTMPEQYKYTIYGPLADMPVDADVVLLFTDAQQGLCITEAVARVDGQMPPAMGRPACAAIPQVIRQNAAAMSLGCCGARAYIETLDSHIALWVLPASKLAEYAGALETMSKANNILTQFHQNRKTDVDAGKRPSVEETLQTLS